MLKTFSLLLSFLCMSVSFAQLTLQQKLQSSMDINTQFLTLLTQSRSQDADFKIIRKSNIEVIQKNIADSIANYKRQLADITSKSANAVSSINGLQDSVTTLKQDLALEQKKTDSISFLGIDFAKSTYHLFVWIIIAVLALGFVIFLLSFRKAKVDTVDHKKTVDILQEELQATKKKAMETEQKLKRQLLDEQLKKNG